MKIDLDQVRQVAQLARLNLSEELMQKLLSHMNDILLYMDLLNELDTRGVEPTAHVQQIHNAFREDRILPALPREKILQNAPQEERHSFVVPRVVQH
jgi:aspartyl-tRNA(Asn)/glutamyl-tRNA(Gln) amidotransferase subunit C